MAVGIIVTLVCVIQASSTWARVFVDHVGPLSLSIGESFNITCYSSTVFTGWKAFYKNGDSVVKSATFHITELQPGITFKLVESKKSTLSGTIVDESLEALQCFSMALDWSEIFTSTVYIEYVDPPTTTTTTNVIAYWPFFICIAVVIIVFMILLGLLMILLCVRYGIFVKPKDQNQDQHDHQQQNDHQHEHEEQHEHEDPNEHRYRFKKKKEPICIIEIQDDEIDEDEEINYLPPPKQFQNIGTQFPPDSNLGPIVVTASVYGDTFVNDSELPPAPVRIQTSYSEESILGIVPAKSEVRCNWYNNMVTYNDDYYEIQYKDVAIQVPELNYKELGCGNATIANKMEVDEEKKHGSDNSCIAITIEDDVDEKVKMNNDCDTVVIRAVDEEEFRSEEVSIDTKIEADEEKKHGSENSSIFICIEEEEEDVRKVEKSDDRGAGIIDAVDEEEHVNGSDTISVEIDMEDIEFENNNMAYEDVESEAKASVMKALSKKIEERANTDSEW